MILKDKFFRLLCVLIRNLDFGREGKENIILGGLGK